MKISKQRTTVKATSTIPAPSVVPATDTTCPYESAICYIQNATRELARVAETDPVAKDSIANLAVVILDLKGNC